MVVFTEVELEDLARFCSKHKFKTLEIRTVHEQARFFKGIKRRVLMILYNSGKLLLQGDSAMIDKTSDHLHSFGIGTKVKQIKFRKESGWVIGSDESLKGDTFGGIVVAAVKANDEIRDKLLAIGVADSKVLADKEILRMAKEVRKIAECEVISMQPAEYNKEKGVTQLLNKLHKKVAKYLKPGVHAVDKYPGCTVGDIMETKAEQKYVEVAAASILARAAALDQLNYLSRQAMFAVPKGSTHVRWALDELHERKLDPRQFVKLHFKNVQEALGE
jgi:ribonuclease HIII